MVVVAFSSLSHLVIFCCSLTSVWGHAVSEHPQQCEERAESCKYKHPTLLQNAWGSCSNIRDYHLVCGVTRVEENFYSVSFMIQSRGRPSHLFRLLKNKNTQWSQPWLLSVSDVFIRFPSHVQMKLHHILFLFFKYVDEMLEMSEEEILFLSGMLWFGSPQ